ncbi:MAG: hypothetical protein AAF721_09770 [Myxococcota bacterium]
MDRVLHRLVAGLMLAAPGCGDSDGGFGDAGLGEDPPSNAGDGDGDGGTGGAPSDDDGGDDGVPEPEMEEEADFRVPRASGRWVYSASEMTNSVAVIDSDTLAIDVVGVGRGPTVVAPLGSQGRVAVLDQGGDDVAMLRTTNLGTTVDIIPTSPGANNLAVSPDGEFVFVYHDVDGPEALGAGSDQELTVIEGETHVAYEMTVGAHPRDIVFSSDASTAFVITDDGVNIVPMDGLAMVGKPDLIPVVSDPAIDPVTLEIQVAADERVALARRDGQDLLFATDLTTGEQFTIELGGIATDLDIAADGTFAIATLPSQQGSRFVEIALPLGGSPTVSTYDVGDEYVGLAHLAPDGDTIILYTTVNPFAADQVPPPSVLGGGSPLGGPIGTGSSGSTDSTSDGGESDSSSEGDGGSTSETGAGTTGGMPPEPKDDPRLRVTLARRDGGWNDQVTFFVDRPVASVGVAPDGENAMLLHGFDDSGAAAPWSYTLLDLTKAFPVKKLQTVGAEPGPVLFTPDGAQAVVLLEGSTRVDLVDLRTFIVDGLALGSPPDGAGFVDETQKVFVSQEHATGRITFIDPDGQVQTVTGFRLNDAVKD